MSTLTFLPKVLLPLLGLVVWIFYYLIARCAYRLPRGAKRYVCGISLLLGTVIIFVFQVNLTEYIAGNDENARQYLFRDLIVIEGSGALIVLFAGLFQERARAKNLQSF